jgi:DNA-binding transcriptional MerR regulator
MSDNALQAVRIETARPDSAPAQNLKPADLETLGQNLVRTFEQYRSDRHEIERKWLRNLRQYLGVYDPEVNRELPLRRSRAYPRITRVKAISVLSRLMNLMFPGNEKNWELKASPSADIDPEEVRQLLQEMMRQDEAAGVPPSPPSREAVHQAVQALAAERAAELEREIEDQLQEIGKDQTMDYITMVRHVVKSGILYGVGALEGPMVQEATVTVWDVDENGQPTVDQRTSYKPVFEVLPVWDFYPDLTAKSLHEMDGYFARKIMSRGQLRKLGDRPDFLRAQIRRVIARHPQGNYKALSFESELRSMGVRAQLSDTKSGAERYEVIIWRGLVSGTALVEAGVDVPEEHRDRDIEAEVWLVDNLVIKVDINAWRKLGVEMRQIHTFVFDEDDTAPVGNGLPNIMRDSQMAICAAARMVLDNGSVIAGPNLEVNTDLLRADQDIGQVEAHKIWYREGTGQDANVPAVRNVPINSYLNELLQVIELFMRFADMETFVGPGTGGEQRGASEPMRTAAGASMLRADAALPFKDIVRNFDSFTQSVIQALVAFNRTFNPKVRPGDYSVIARGATSLIAKEVRGIQLDQMAATLSPEDRLHINDRKFIKARFDVRDLADMLVPEDEVERRQKAGQQRVQQQAEQQSKLAEAQIRKLLSDALKNIAQSKKNAANADATQMKIMLDMLAQTMESGGNGDDT